MMMSIVAGTAAAIVIRRIRRLQRPLSHMLRLCAAGHVERLHVL